MKKYILEMPDGCYGVFDTYEEAKKEMLESIEWYGMSDYYEIREEK